MPKNRESSAARGSFFYFTSPTSDKKGVCGLPVEESVDGALYIDAGELEPLTIQHSTEFGGGFSIRGPAHMGEAAHTLIAGSLYFLQEGDNVIPLGVVPAEFHCRQSDVAHGFSGCFWKWPWFR